MLVEGLPAKGWTVDAVVAYRTVAATVEPAVLARAAAADAITFTSGSTVRSFVAAAGRDAVPATVVCIGPVTAAAALDAGLTACRGGGRALARRTRRRPRGGAGPMRAR